jgi:hypothetical protein
VTTGGRIDGVYIEHGDGEFLSYPSDHFRVDNGNFVLLPPVKLRAKALCQEIPLIWRKDEALNELLGKKRIPSGMFEDLHKNFEGALNQLKEDAQSILGDIETQIAKCVKQIQELHSALINLEIEREIGRIDVPSYQKALEMIQWGLKSVNAEKNDFEALQHKLSSMLLGDKKTETPTTPEQQETEETPDSAPTTLPEPPVTVHVKNAQKQES